jgi:hypothetical protein
LFHKEKRHDIEDYFMLRNEIERLIFKGYLKQFVKGNAHVNQDKEERSQPIKALLEINVILRGTWVGETPLVARGNIRNRSLQWLANKAHNTSPLFSF